LAKVNASWVESEVSVNMASINKPMIMLVRILNDFVDSCLPLSNSGTNRNIVRAEVSAIACLVLVIAGASIGSAIYAATFSTARIRTDWALEFLAIS